MSPTKGNIHRYKLKDNPDVGFIQKNFKLAIIIMSNEAKEDIFITSEKTNILSTKNRKYEKEPNGNTRIPEVFKKDELNRQKEEN